MTAKTNCKVFRKGILSINIYSSSIVSAVLIQLIFPVNRPTFVIGYKESIRKSILRSESHLIGDLLTQILTFEDKSVFLFVICATLVLYNGLVFISFN